MRSLIAVIVGVFVLSACGFNAPPSEHNSPTPAPTLSNVDLYLTVVYDEYPELEGNDETLVNYAHATCDALDAGATVQDLADVAIESGLDVGMVGYITGAGIESFCPEHRNLLDNGASL